MAVPVWPEGLPQYLNIQGHGQALGDGRIRTPTEKGPGKVRRRFSSVAQPLSGVIRMTSAQTIAADAFVADVLRGGSLPFRFPEPRTRALVLVRFADALPSFSCIGGDWYEYTMSLEILP